MDRRFLSLAVVCLLLTSSVAGGLAVAQSAARSWQRVPGASRFVRPGSAEVSLELRRVLEGPCGGGGCSSEVEIRNVRGTLPSRSLTHYYSDRPGHAPGCFGEGDGQRFADWTEIVLARARGGEADRPSCGIAISVGDDVQYWVILRARPVAAPAASAP